jgi:hypothetical protein
VRDSLEQLSPQAKRAGRQRRLSGARNRLRRRHDVSFGSLLEMGTLVEPISGACKDPAVELNKIQTPHS